MGCPKVKTYSLTPQALPIDLPNLHQEPTAVPSRTRPACFTTSYPLIVLTETRSKSIALDSLG